MSFVSSLNLVLDEEGWLIQHHDHFTPETVPVPIIEEVVWFQFVWKI